MYDLTNISYFIIASFLLTIAPGPDIIFLIAQTLNHGPKAGVPTALGLTFGNLIHTLAVALGISLLIQASEQAFTFIKILGACYLLYLAYEVITAQSAHTKEHIELSRHSLFVRGILMNLLNPKVILFFIAFLPQFVSPNAQNIWVEMVFFGVLFTLIVLITFGSIGLFAGYFVKLTTDKLIITTSFKWIVVIIYILLAARIIL